MDEPTLNGVPLPPGALHEALTDLRSTLATLAETVRTELRGYGALTTDLHSEVTALEQRMPQAPPQTPPSYEGLAPASAGELPRLHGTPWFWSAGGGFTLGLAAMGLAWGLWPPPEPIAARVFTPVDQVLVQQWHTVPKPLQERLSAAYSRAGGVSPAQRQAKGGTP